MLPTDFSNILPSFFVFLRSIWSLWNNWEKFVVIFFDEKHIWACITRKKNSLWRTVLLCKFSKTNIMNSRMLSHSQKSTKRKLEIENNYEVDLIWFNWLSFLFFLKKRIEQKYPQFKGISNFEGLKWSISVVRSRMWTIKELPGKYDLFSSSFLALSTENEKKEKEKFTVGLYFSQYFFFCRTLVPLADMLNHHPQKGVALGI